MIRYLCSFFLSIFAQPDLFFPLVLDFKNIRHRTIIFIKRNFDFFLNFPFTNYWYILLYLSFLLFLSDTHPNSRLSFYKLDGLSNLLLIHQNSWWVVSSLQPLNGVSAYWDLPDSLPFRAPPPPNVAEWNCQVCLPPPLLGSYVYST